jgi:hypothetical protein
VSRPADLALLGELAALLVELAGVEVDGLSDDDCRDSFRSFARSAASLGRRLNLVGVAPATRPVAAGGAVVASVPGVGVGDVVVMRPGFGGDAPIQARVTQMEITRGARQKSGKSVQFAGWHLIEANRVIFSLDNGHWCYSEQVDSVVGEGRPQVNRGRA